MSDYLDKKLSQVSSSPGVYLMKDVKGELIYVGKAGNLKKRISSYFSGSGHNVGATPCGCPELNMKTGLLVKKIADFETILTRNEHEALLLESNLIKEYKPRYNVILKDDKRYPSLRLDITNPYPNLTMVRKPENDGALYFGPFSSPGAVYQTLKIINKTFKIRKCKSQVIKSRNRPCLNYQIGACPAPCCFDVDKDAYHETIKEIILFLKGRTPDLIHKIKRDMRDASDREDYETAAILRDKVSALEKILEKQVSVTTDFKDRDVFAIVSENEQIVITVLFVRGGYLLQTRHFEFTEILSTDEEMIGAFIRQYYENAQFIPKEILVPIILEDAYLTEAWLKQIRGESVKILYPMRGEKKQLVEMAQKNAGNRLREIIASANSEKDRLCRLQKRLGINRIPNHIECFDNSNISGKSAVAGMVVFKNGKACKSLFRQYKIKTVANHNDDYAYMSEALKRRYGKGEESKPFPDLLIVDGGKGQLNIAVSVIKELGLEGAFDIISIAKKDEKQGDTDDKIYKPGRANPVNFSREKDLLLFLQQIRDKAHHYALSFHRKQRGATAINSLLDTIPGIGKKRKQILLKHFSSIKNIRAATIDELIALPGMNRKAAEEIKKVLKNPK